jgi:hypothetical protein
MFISDAVTAFFAGGVSAFGAGTAAAGLAGAASVIAEVTVPAASGEAESAIDSPPALPAAVAGVEVGRACVAVCGGAFAAATAGGATTAPES